MPSSKTNLWGFIIIYVEQVEQSPGGVSKVRFWGHPTSRGASNRSLGKRVVRKWSRGQLITQPRLSIMFVPLYRLERQRVVIVEGVFRGYLIL